MKEGSMLMVKVLAVAVILSLGSVLPGIAMAQEAPPQPPHIFTGRAIVNGLSAQEGTKVTAWSNVGLLAQTTLLRGRYMLVVPEPANSQSIAFSIGDFPAEQTATWQAGGASVLDLTGLLQNPLQALPHVFTGRATVDGISAADGTVVTAWSDGNLLAQTTLQQGRYTLLVPQPATSEGIAFNIGEYQALEMFIWEPGGASLLDLTTQSSWSSLDSVLNPSNGNLVRVFHWDRQTGVWTYFDPLVNPSDRTKFRLAPGQEYWIKVVREQRVHHHSRETPLLAGWNTVVW